MSWITILLFFLYLYGLGFALSRLRKERKEKSGNESAPAEAVSAVSRAGEKSTGHPAEGEAEDSIERHLMRLGTGLCVFIVLGVILNLLRVPLHWWIFLLLSLAVPAAALLTNRKKNGKFFREGFWQNLRERISFPGKIRKSHLLYLLLLALFAFNLYTYSTGSLGYPYMEDDDPWTYVREMKYVAVEKKLDVPYERGTNYLDPYPPAYAFIMGVLHQTSPDAQWTIKFFNALLISLGFLFFFFMVKSLTKSSPLALAGTFILSMLPSYLSHFVWSHSLIPGLFMVAIYSYQKVREAGDGDVRENIGEQSHEPHSLNQGLNLGLNYSYFSDYSLIAAAGFATAAILLTHPFQALKLGIMIAIYFMVVWAYDRKLPLKVAGSLLLGGVLSLSWWFFKWKAIAAQRLGAAASSAVATETGEAGAAVSAGSQNFGLSLLETFLRLLKTLSPTGGSATRAYTFSDFFYAQKTNLINQPIGWGIAVSLLLLAGVLLLLWKYRDLARKEAAWKILALSWLAFTFLFVNSATFNLPIGFGAFRIWMLLAIPVSILAGYGMLTLARSFRGLKVLVLLLLVISVFATSGYYKYYHNTNPGWPPGRFMPEELQGYIWMKSNLPLNTPVFMYEGKYNRFVFGVNMFACVWCEDYRAFEAGIWERNVTDVHSWMRTHGYQYLLFSTRQLAGQETEEAQKRQTVINEVAAATGRFQVAYQTPAMVLFKAV